MPPGLPPSTARERRLAEAGVLVVMVAWAANFIIVKSANEQIPPVTFAFLRFGIAAVTLLLALRVRDGSFGWPGRDAVAIMGLGALGFGVYQFMWSIALQQIPAGDSALLIAATPVFTALLAVVSGADFLTRTKLLGSLVSFAGVGVIVATGPGLTVGGAIVGDALTLAAAICWSIYTAFGAPILRRHSPLQTTAWAMAGGSLVLLGPAVVQGVVANWPAVGLEAWAGLAFSALIPAGLANVVVFSAIKLLGPTRITAYQFLVPFIAVLLGAAFLAEPVRAGQLLGGLVIVLGVVVTRSDRLTAFGGWLRERAPG
ncbi:MAG TPA: DMT family transporter [Candidatus Dormibacteraeota bacterium]|nr:DMT family transporter [Candidatus Dormibacteraeota bacterium]